MLLVALVLGGMSVFILRGWIASQTAPPPQPVAENASVVVASGNLAYGAKLSPENLKLVNWPAGAVPAGAFTRMEDVVGTSADKSRVALRSIATNEPILSSAVSAPGGRATLSSVMNEQMRAMTIRVNDVYGVAGFVLPGDHVDVLLTRGGQGESPTTDILLQNITVLGIDQDNSDKKDKPTIARAVTLEVGPEQAQKLALASSVGTLSLTLRNLSNVEAVKVRSIGLGDLRVGEANVEAPKTETPAPPPRVAVTEPPPPSVRIVRGTAASQYEVFREGGAARRASAGKL
jgi:pilus assembly protein CpaB